MRTSKYILSALLVVTVLTFIGETHVWHISEFEVQYPYVTFYPQKGVTQEKMLSDVKSAADKEAVTVFVVNRKVESAISEQIDIYGTKGTDKFLKQDADLEEAVYDSIFLGQTKISIHSLNEIPDVTRIDTYRVVGGQDNLIRFKQKLVDQYAGAFPRQGYEPFNSKLNITMAWSIALALFLLLTLYQVALMKKEMIIRLVSGESLTDFVLRNILLDVGFYILLFLSSFMVLNRFTKVTYHIELSLLCMSLFLILNSLLYVGLLFTDYKRDLTSNSSAKTILKISYFYKIATIFITVVIMSGGIVLISEGVDCYRQKDFFAKHRTDSYLMISSMNEDGYEIEESLQQQIYRDFAEKSKACALVELSGMETKDQNYIYADRGAVSYLREQIPELKDKNLEEKAYIIKPENYKKTGNSADETKELFDSYGNEGMPKEEILYEGNIKIVAQNGENGVEGRLKKNPAILLNNAKDQQLDGYIWQATMINLTYREWDDYLKKFNFENEITYRTNVYDNYIHHWHMLKRGMILGIVLICILLVMESIIIHTTLYYEYRINAIELSLKKIFGYNLFERHRKIIMATVITGIFGLTSALLSSYFLNIGNYLYMLAAGIAIIMVELAMVGMYVYKLEKINVQRILKGGSL